MVAEPHYRMRKPSNREPHIESKRSLQLLASFAALCRLLR